MNIELLANKLRKKFCKEGKIKKSSYGRFYVVNDMPFIEYSSDLNFIHEFCHYEQWKEGFFLEYSFKDAINQSNKEAFDKIIEIELDCEKRVLSILNKNKIKHNYEKRINSYLFLCHKKFKKESIDFYEKSRIYDNSKNFLLKKEDYLNSPQSLLF